MRKELFIVIGLTAAAIAVVFVSTKQQSACRTFTNLAQALRQPEVACALNVSGQGLTGALPAEIRTLINLSELDASDNNLTGIPAEIGQLSKLRTIDFSNNQLDTYPNEFGNIPQLEELNLSGNRYSEATLNNLRALLPTTDIIADR